MSEYQLSIEYFIETIIDIANEEVYESEFEDARDIFLHGQCYDFAKVLKHYITNSFIVINNNEDHCAVQFQGRIYDANGDVTDKFNGHIATEDDINYMENNFSIPEKSMKNGKRISEWLIDAIREYGYLEYLPFYKPNILSPSENTK